MKSSRFLAAVLAFASLVAPLFATPAVTTATMSDNISSGTRTVKQGDTITYTTTLTNNSGSALTNVVLADPTPANTTLVPGSVHASPIANTDSYTLVGNTKLYVGTTPPVGEPAVTSATGLLANDTVITDTVSITNNSTPLHGAVTVNADGTFTYTPAVGYKGTDSFTYTLTNNADTSLSDTGTVTLTITDPVWYVDNSKTSGTGASTSPLNSLTTLAAVNSTNGPATSDTIFLYKGNAAYAGNITLKTSQKLTGQGVDLTVGGATLVAAGTGNTPTVNGVVTLAGSTTVTGLQLSGTSASLAGSSVSGITVNIPTVANTGGGSAINFTTVGGIFAFTSISSSSGTATGIYINGLTGSFTVAGSGTAGSGGTIANKTGNDGSTTTGCGIYLNNAQNIYFARMQLNDFSNFAILGNNVDGLSLTNSTISGTNGTNSTTAPEDAVSFTNLTSPSLIGNCNISGGCVDNLRIANSSGTLNRLRVTSNTFGLNGATTGNDSVSLSASGTATLNASIDSNQFSGARGDVIDCTGQTGTTMDIVIGNNTSANTHTGTLSGGGGVMVQSAGTATFNVSTNTLTGARGRALVVAKGGTGGTLTGTIARNLIGASATSLSGSLEASGIFVDGSGTGKLTVSITNNTVNQTNEAGIYLVTNNQSIAGNNGTLNATVSDNIVSNPGPLTFAAFFADVGTGVNTEASSAFLDVHDNTFSGTSTAYLGTFDVSAASSTAVRLPNYTGSATDTAAVATYLTGRNPLSTATTKITATAGGTYSGGVAFLSLAPVAPVETRTLNAERPTSNVEVVSVTPVANPAPAASVNAALTEAALQRTVAHARNLWMDTGLTSAQAAILNGLSFNLGDLTDRHLGAADGSRVTIDRLAGGRGWSAADTVSARELDLLTAILHEMGHALGLDDTYAAADHSNLMYGYLAPGERRLPVANQAAGALPAASGQVHFVTASLTIGTVPNGKTVTVKRQVVVGALTAANAQITAQDTWSGSNGFSLTTNDTDVAGTGNATVTLIAVPPAVTTNPADTSAASGTSASFTVAATGAAAPTVQWQVSTNSGATFNNVAGANSATLTFTALTAQNGYLYRAVFTNSAGNATTTAATLTVTAPNLVSIAVTPAGASVNKGTTQQFTATGTYTDATTQDLTSTVTWTSGTPATATISNSGLATGVAIGTSLITATSGSITDSKTLSVVLPKASLLGAAASVNAANTLSYTVPAGTNRLLVVTASHPDNTGAALTAVTFGSLPMTQAVLSTDGRSAIDSIWILPMGSSANPTTGTITVTPNVGASTRPCGFISAQTFKDTNQASPVQTVGVANVGGGTANSTLTIASSASDTLFDLFDVYSGSSGLTATAGNGQTVISNSGAFEIKNAGSTTYAGYGLWKTSTKAGTGATTVTSWTSNATAYLSAAISIKQAPDVSAPTVTSPTSATITGTTATLGGNVTSDGGATITKRGVLYAKTTLNNNPTVGGSDVTEVDDAGVTTGSFTVGATGLTPSTGYSYVGFATNSAGTSYTSVDTFTTAAVLVSIAVTPSNPTVPKGLTQQFTATGTYSDNSTQNLTSSVTWTSGTTANATIDSSGLATAISSSGTSLITATSGSVSGSTTLTVTAPTLVSIAVTPGSPSIPKGSTQQFTATGTYSDNSTQDLSSSVTWSSGNTSRATISNAAGSQGLATGVSVGTSLITATSGSVNGSSTLTVTAAELVAIAVTPSSPTVPKGLTQQFAATGIYTDGTTQNLTSSVSWTSGTTANATIDSSGLATAISASGTSLITATSGSVSGAATLTASAPTITLSPTTLTNPAVGSATSQSITASGGTATYTYAVTAGSLPAGLTLASNGSLTGTATAAGAYNFTVTATDSSTGPGAPFTGSRAYSITVSAPTITLSPTTLTGAAVGSAISQTITASGGTATYTYAVTAGALPAGVTLSSGGTLTGTPTAAGTFNFTITATDSTTGTGAPFTGSRTYALTASMAIITLSPTSLTSATVGTATSQTITASGGTAAYSYRVSSGSLPAGVTLSSDGTLAGTPTEAGTFGFNVTAVDSSTGPGAPFSASRLYSLTVGAPTISLSPSTALPDSQANQSYSHNVTAIGGTAPYAFAVTSGALPTGLTLNSSGLVSGTPTAGGRFTFTITATDSTTGTGPFTGSRAYTIVIAAAPTVTSPASSYVSGNSATLGGTVNSDGASALSGAGIVLSPTNANSDPKLGGNGVLTFTGITTATPYPLSVPVSGLVLGTQYSYAAYATNAVGTGYSAVGTFTTAGTGSHRDDSSSDFDAGTMTGLSTSISPGDLVIDTTVTLDQQNTTLGSGSTSISTTIWGGQSFTPANTGRLTSIDLNLFATNMTGTTPDIIVGIRAVDTNGLPTGSDLATATIPGFSDSTAGYHTATFATPCVVTAGTQYAFVVHPVSNPSAGSYSLSRSGTANTGDDVYPGGARLQGPVTGTFWAVVLTPAGTGTTTDLVFKIYVTPTAGTFTSAVKDSHLPAGVTHWTTLSWSADEGPYGSVKFQVAASDNPDGPFTFVGPDGTAGTYFTASDASLLQFYGHRYLQYRAFLSTDNPAVSPYLHDVTVGYDLSVPAPVAQLTFAPDSIPLTQSTTLTVTVTNPTTHPLTGVALAATLQAGLAIGNPSNLSAPASGTVTAPAGGTAIDLTGATLAAKGSLTFSVAVVSTGTQTDKLRVDATLSSTESDAGEGAAAALIITQPEIVLSPYPQIPSIRKDVAYSQVFTAQGGIAPYTYAVTQGTLPAGLTLEPNGTLSGTASTVGIYNFTLTATDSGTGAYTGSTEYRAYVIDRPVVDTPSKANITGNSADLGGRLSNDNLSFPREAGIVLSPTDVNSEPRLGGNGVVTFTTGTTAAPFNFGTSVTGLALGTQYSYAAYVTNEAGTGYSATATFTTASSGDLSDYLNEFSAGTRNRTSTSANPDGLVLEPVTGVVDQANEVPADANGTVYLDNSYTIAQTFTPGVSGLLSAVDLQLATNTASSPDNRPDIWVGIRRVNTDGQPTGDDVAAGVISAVRESTFAYHTAMLFTPLQVEAGTKYAIIIQPMDGPTGDNPYMLRSNGNTYPGGEKLSFAYGTWFGSDTDISFRTYIGTDQTYPNSAGDLVSAVKDSYLSAGITHWTTLTWTADLPEGTGLKFQVAASDSPDGPFAFVGPDGTADTYFTESGGSLAQFYGHRYLKYRAFLTTEDSSVTPTLNNVTLGYDLVAPPTVSATAAADVTGVSATLGGNVTFDGGGVISARGIVLSPTSTNANPTLNGQGVVVIPASTNGPGAYTVSAAELTRGTGYSYAAYATNQGGTTYSTVATFTTVAIPVITNNPLTASATYGTTFGGYTVAASSSPTSYAAEGLPTGLSINSDTGVISGKPTVTGSFNVALSATNVAGTGTATLVITVAKAQLTVTADAKSKVYGSSNPAATYVISGFVNGETLATSDVTGTPALAVNADATTAVGSATIVPSVGTLASAHYSFAFANGALSITKYALTVTADPKARIYGAANPTLTATITGFLNGQNLGTSGVTGSPVVTTAAVPTTPVGGATITVAAGTLSAANYSFNLVNGTLAINRATLTVTAEPKQRTYGAADPAFTATITGYVNGETASVVSGTPSYTTNATATSPIGQYVITPATGSLSAANYAFSFATGALTISPATLTLSVNAATKPYGSDNPVLTARYLGFLNGETETVVSGAPVLTTTAVKSSPVGNYPITVTAGTLSAANYVFNTTSVLSSNQLTVTKAPLTVRVTDQARAYGAANATPAVTYAGFVLDETAAVLSGAPVATHTATVASPAGAYTISLAAGTLAATNYSFTLVPGTLTVNQAALTVTADAKSKTYGTANPALTVTISGFANGENLATSGITGAAAVTTTATANSDIGTYPITAAVGTLAAPNYRFGTFNEGVFTITAASLAVTLDGLSRTYDGQPKPVTVTTTPSGVATTVLYAGNATPPTDAGSYAVTATATSANYTGSAQGTLVIAPAAQTITFPAPASVTVNLPLTLTATATSGLPVTFSVVSGHATLDGGRLTVADNGAVVVRATQAGNGNYLSATKDITLSNVALASQTITFDQPASHTTAESSFTLVATASSGLPVTFTYVNGPGSVSGNTVKLNNTAGTVVVRASQPGNASYSAAADVFRSITITAKSAQVFFGGFGNQGAKDVSATAVAIGGGLAASLTADGQNSTLIGYLPTSGDGFVLKFNLAADGTFSATTTSIPNPTAASPVEARGPGTRSTAAMALAAATLTFHGQVAGGILSGVIDELSLPFSAEIQPDTGSTAALAGFYQAAPLNSASGNIYSVVSANGGAFVLAITPTYVGGGSGSVNTGGSFTISTPQSGVVTGSVDAASTSVTGTLTLPSQPAQNFAGLGTNTTRTDRLVNLSSRALITPNSGDSTLITGFVIGGTTAKQVLLRGVGPALAGYGVQNPAAAPQLRVFDSAGRLVGQNSGWNNDPAIATLAGNLGAAPLAANSKDAAIALTLAPGAYSMHVFTTGTAGVALAEIYDANTAPAYERLLNISTRGPVSSGEGVLIAGFVVTGNSPKRVLIRGAGPGLTQQGVSGVLADPVVRLYDRTNTVIARNDNWETPVTVGSGQTAATAADITAANAQLGAFAFATGSKDAALIVVLAPGVYSAQVGSATNASGNALVEVYELP